MHVRPEQIATVISKHRFFKLQGIILNFHNTSERCVRMEERTILALVFF